MSKDGDSEPKLPIQQLAILAIARFSEPIAYTSIYPYVPDMIRSFGVAENDIASWAGLISGAFSLAQSLAAVPWSGAADRYGRKPILIIGLLSTMTCFVVWSLSKSLAMAITVRIIQGGSNGNKFVPEKKLQPRAFSIMPIVWSLGSVIGPAFGGFFAEPAKRFPDLFGRIPFFITFPYALPNLLASIFFLISTFSVTFFLKETLVTKRDRDDWGLQVGQRLTRVFSRRRAQIGRNGGGEGPSTYDGGDVMTPASRPATNTAAGANTQAAWAEVLTYQTMLALFSYSFLFFHSVSFDQNISVFLSTPVIPRTPDNYRPPFYFNGGFGLDPGTIGTIFVIYGITSAAIQFIVYPVLVTRFGVLCTFHVCSIFLPIVYCATPYASLFTSARVRFAAIVVVMLLKAFCLIMSFPSTTILFNNSCRSLRVLSSVNGLATMMSGIFRAVGPASTGRVFTWGAHHGYIISAYFFLGAAAALGAIPGFLIVEGDGPTAAEERAEVEAAAEGGEGSGSPRCDDERRPLMARR
ncbi:Major facilitator superfamily domain, general substrate transporter [Cordyceps fumosorosea ARSEF 2679]|uniref:Major facilitator superfamily domain, general substrate transporter n=1 Tax=Cordyceps fumosorosea (strain ARSEF 2679) TaxID=1081104 RepID=A0A167MJX8_CORFA|nr:Major facilitator superfamily domain, general substrate transporter [Cordyceps fumosorosea ARSEF 2679]OAA54447.1 Major facilitator superfamily domain, general substrate transporter [Cordyceps fumosorosea ARSEF 2679]